MSDVARLAAALVAIDSTNPDLVPGAAGEGEIARFVHDWLVGAGLETGFEEVAAGRPNVVAVARGSGDGKTLLLNAHTDTVGVGGMTDPFAPRIEGDRLYGRGAFDMKGSLAAIMLVGAAAARRGWRGDLVVAAVADEEFASIGSAALVERWRADAASGRAGRVSAGTPSPPTPSPAAAGEGVPPGRMDEVFSRIPYGAAIVAEPTGLEVCVAHKGFVWLEVETRGAAAHGSRPDLGVDAIAAMGPVLTGIAALERRLAAGVGHPLLGTGSVHASLISGGRELSTYPDRCTLAIERRTIPGETTAGAEEEVRTILEAAPSSDPTRRASLRTTLTRDPFEIASDHPFVALVRGRATTVLGAEPALTGAFGWMDSALLAAAGIPTVVFGPAGAGAHADEEWVDLPSLERTRSVLLAVAEAVCA